MRLEEFELLTVYCGDLPDFYINVLRINSRSFFSILKCRRGEFVGNKMIEKTIWEIDLFWFRIY